MKMGKERPETNKKKRNKYENPNRRDAATLFMFNAGEIRQGSKPTSPPSAALHQRDEIDVCSDLWQRTISNKDEAPRRGSLWLNQRCRVRRESGSAVEASSCIRAFCKKKKNTDLCGPCLPDPAPLWRDDPDHGHPAGGPAVCRAC